AADRPGRAAGTRRRLIGDDLPVARDQPTANAALVDGTRERQLGHGGDAWERLAQKAERLDPAQVVLDQLARRVPLAREPELVRRNAHPIVAHPNELEATASYVNPDLARSGVQGVLDQLFDDRGR